MLLSNESTFLGLLNAMQLAFIECNKISTDLSLRIRNKEELVILPTYASTGRWINNYWLSGNKVGRNGFKKYYESLRKIKHFNSSLDSLVYSAQKDEGTSKYKFFNEICVFLFHDLPTISNTYCHNHETAQSIRRMSSRLSKEYENFSNAVDMTQKIMRGAYDYDCKPVVKEKSEKKSPTFGQQYQSIEQIINEQLKFLSSYMSKDEIAKLRSKLAKSDNKLRMLDEEMKNIELPF